MSVSKSHNDNDHHVDDNALSVLKSESEQLLMKNQKAKVKPSYSHSAFGFKNTPYARPQDSKINLPSDRKKINRDRNTLFSKVRIKIL